MHEKMIYYSQWPMNDFIDYVETHSETPRALFSKAQVAQMLHLSGYPAAAKAYADGPKEWYSVDMRDLVAEAKNLVV